MKSGTKKSLQNISFYVPTPFLTFIVQAFIFVSHSSLFLHHVIRHSTVFSKLTTKRFTQSALLDHLHSVRNNVHSSPFTNFSPTAFPTDSLGCWTSWRLFPRTTSSPLSLCLQWTRDSSRENISFLLNKHHKRLRKNYKHPHNNR